MRRKIQPIRTVVPAKAGPLHNSGARPRSWQERISSNPFAELSNPDCLPGIPNLSPEDGRPELCKGPAKAGTHLSASSGAKPWVPAFAGNALYLERRVSRAGGEGRW